MSTLTPTEQLAALYKEMGVRRHGGACLAWIVEDRLCGYLILAQKLSHIRYFVNVHVEGSDRVSVSGMYKIARSPNGLRRQGYTKGRWHVTACELEGAARAYEEIWLGKPFVTCSIGRLTF